MRTHSHQYIWMVREKARERTDTHTSMGREQSPAIFNLTLRGIFRRRVSTDFTRLPVVSRRCGASSGQDGALSTLHLPRACAHHPPDSLHLPKACVSLPSNKTLPQSVPVNEKRARLRWTRVSGWG